MRVLRAVSVLGRRTQHQASFVWLPVSRDRHTIHTGMRFESSDHTICTRWSILQGFRGHICSFTCPSFLLCSNAQDHSCLLGQLVKTLWLPVCTIRVMRRCNIAPILLVTIRVPLLCALRDPPSESRVALGPPSALYVSVRQLEQGAQIWGHIYITWVCGNTHTHTETLQTELPVANEYVSPATNVEAKPVRL